MDFAYDQIAARTYSNDRSATPKPSDDSTTSDSTSSTPTREPDRQNLQSEFQETFKAFSASPWGTKLGGWWSTARTQGASYYETARKEAEKREAEAAKALEEARKIVVERTKNVVEAAEERLDSIVNEEKRAELQQQREEQARLEEEEAAQAEEAATASGIPRDSPASEQEDTETFLARFKSEAAKRLKEVHAAEDAADEALLRFGTNIRNFLQDTISVTAPEPSLTSNASQILFESKDATTGKRVIHTSRFEAQLHVIHTTPSSFTRDPDATEQQWEMFKKTFDIEKETDVITRDLEKYPELRGAMEKYVPEQVEYKDFWTRYYFLRYVVEMQDEKRKELLKASTVDTEEEVAWDEESSSDSDEQPKTIPVTSTTSTPANPTTDSTTSQPPPSTSAPPPPDSTSPSTYHSRTDSDAITLKAPRRSHDEKSVADSEASYDLVSGAASHAASSPKVKGKSEDSEDEDDDWE